MLPSRRLTIRTPAKAGDWPQMPMLNCWSMTIFQISCASLFRSAPTLEEAERNKLAQEIWKIVIDQQFSIGICGQSPAFAGVRMVSRRLGNIPQRVCIAQHCRTPGSSHPTTWYFKS